MRMPYVDHFLCANDNVKKIFDAFQIMHHMLCYFNFVLFFDPRTKLRKSLIPYYKKWNNMFRKHVDANN
jgi:hypothetical protein